MEIDPERVERVFNIAIQAWEKFRDDLGEFLEVLKS